MSYRFSVAQLEQFVVSKKLSRTDADTLLAYHYPEAFAASLAVTMQLLEDVRVVNRINHYGENCAITKDVMETLAKCFKCEITMDTPLSEKWMPEKVFSDVIHGIEHKHDMEFDEDEPSEWQTVGDVVNAVLELTEE